jgi:hypothetical protein
LFGAVVRRLSAIVRRLDNLLFLLLGDLPSGKRTGTSEGLQLRPKLCNLLLLDPEGMVLVLALPLVIVPQILYLHLQLLILQLHLLSLVPPIVVRRLLTV